MPPKCIDYLQVTEAVLVKIIFHRGREMNETWLQADKISTFGLQVNCIEIKLNSIRSLYCDKKVLLR